MEGWRVKEWRSKPLTGILKGEQRFEWAIKNERGREVSFEGFKPAKDVMNDDEEMFGTGQGDDP